VDVAWKDASYKQKCVYQTVWAWAGNEHYAKGRTWVIVSERGRENMMRVGEIQKILIRKTVRRSMPLILTVYRKCKFDSIELDMELSDSRLPILKL